MANSIVLRNGAVVTGSLDITQDIDAREINARSKYKTAGSDSVTTGASIAFSIALG